MWDVLPNQNPEIPLDISTPPSISREYQWDTQQAVVDIMTKSGYKYNPETNSLMRIAVSTGYQAPVFLHWCPENTILRFDNRETLFSSVFQILSECSGEKISPEILKNKWNNIVSMARNMDNPSVNTTLDTLIGNLSQDTSIVWREIFRILNQLRSQTDESRFGRIAFGTPIYDFDDRFKSLLEQYKNRYSKNDIAELIKKIEELLSRKGKKIENIPNRDYVQSVLEDLISRELTKYTSLYKWRESIETLLDFVGKKLGVDIGFISIGWAQRADGMMMIRLWENSYALIWRNSISYGKSPAILVEKDRSATGNIVFRHYLFNTRGDVIGIVRTHTTEYLSRELSLGKNYTEWMLYPDRITPGVSLDLHFTNLGKNISLTAATESGWYTKLWLSEKDIYNITIRMEHAEWWFKGDKFSIAAKVSTIKTEWWESRVLSMRSWVNLLSHQVGDWNLSSGTLVNLDLQWENKKKIQTASADIKSGVKLTYNIDYNTNMKADIWWYQVRTWAPQWLLLAREERNPKHFEKWIWYYGWIESPRFGIRMSQQSILWEEESKVSVHYTHGKTTAMINYTSTRTHALLGAKKEHEYSAWLYYQLYPTTRIGLTTYSTNIGGTESKGFQLWLNSGL
jgi:hypothetical protein